MYKGLHVVKYDASLQKLASSFHSGNDYLDRFLRDTISRDDGFGKTYVLLSDDNRTIIGYYNLGLGYIEQQEYGRTVKMGGAVHINCFALDTHYHGALQGYTDEGIKINLSDALLVECLSRIEVLRREHIGFSFVTLSSTKEGYALYLRNGFEKLEDDMQFTFDETEVSCIPMYLSLNYE